MNRRFTPKTVALASLFTLSGCSLLLKNDGKQCSTNADCSALGFQGSVCDIPAGVCKKTDTEGSGGQRSSGGANSSGTNSTAGTTQMVEGGAGGGRSATEGGAGAGESGAGGDAGAAGAGGQSTIPPECGDQCSVPVGIRVNQTELLTYAGSSTAGVLHSDVCPLDQVAIGVRSYIGTRVNSTFLQRMQVLCGTIVLSNARTGALTVKAGAATPVRGEGFPDDTRVDRVCPANQVVVGHAAYYNSGGAVESLQLRCAPLAVEGAPGSYTVVTGTAQDLEWAGPTTAANKTKAVDCAAGAIARGLQVRAGTVVNGLAAICGVPSYTYPVGANCAGASDCDSLNCSDNRCAKSSCEPSSDCSCSAFESRWYSFCKTPSGFYAALEVCRTSEGMLAQVQDTFENGWLRLTANELK
ncbi:MAG TPA: hypothetical protein VFQ61_14630, partial [Polyangiaceae bacterium]|nr:hypothetical protein [Polyangiaceae bacterium]